jgi:hypothetical protein
MGVAARQVRSMVRKGTNYTALVPTVIGVGEQDPARMVVAVRQVRSMVRKVLFVNRLKFSCFANFL